MRSGSATRIAGVALSCLAAATVFAGCGSNDDSNSTADQVASVQKQIDELKAKARKAKLESRELKQQIADSKEKVAKPPATGNSETARSFTSFQSPTGNIACYMDSKEGARCDIAKKTWAAPAKPSSCTLDWGSGLSIKRGEGTFVCAGDTVMNPGAPILKYGESSSQGAFSCESSESGMNCINTGTGHGFILSRADALVY
ncbi:MAG: DUF6636 domain-containing protein [Solirubrobacterales bacterium]